MCYQFYPNNHHVAGAIRLASTYCVAPPSLLLIILLLPTINAALIEQEGPKVPTNPTLAPSFNSKQQNTPPHRSAVHYGQENNGDVATVAVVLLYIVLMMGITFIGGVAACICYSRYYSTRNALAGQEASSNTRNVNTNETEQASAVEGEEIVLSPMKEDRRLRRLILAALFPEQKAGAAGVGTSSSDILRYDPESKHYRWIGNEIPAIDSICSICLENLDGNGCVVSGVCLHLYHRDCILEWLNKKTHDDCPNCRQRMWDSETYQLLKQEILQQSKSADIFDC